MDLNCLNITLSVKNTVRKGSPDEISTSGLWWTGVVEKAAWVFSVEMLNLSVFAACIASVVSLI